MKPLLVGALKGNNKKGASQSTRTASIPMELMSFKEPLSDEKTRKMAKQIGEILIISDLAGEDNMFSTIGDGGSFKGRLIRSFVFSQTAGKPHDAKRLFMSMLMDMTIRDDVEAYMNSVITILGDDAQIIRERMQMITTEVLIDLDDDDFDHALSVLV